MAAVADRSEFALKPIFDQDPIQLQASIPRTSHCRSLLSSRSLTRTRSNGDAVAIDVWQSEFALKPIFDQDPIQQSHVVHAHHASRSLLSSRSLTRTRSNAGSFGLAQEHVGVCSQADL